MSNFKTFKKEMQTHISTMLVGQDRIFVTDVSKYDLWNTYLDSFPTGTNEIYKERREFDCNCCKSFMRAFGNAVVVVNNNLVSIWDMEVSDPTFAVVAKKMSALVKSAPIRSVFVTDEANVGTDKNRQQLEDGGVCTWEHYHYKLPIKFVNKTGKSTGDIQGTTASFRQVFQRSMAELTLDAGETILDLIDQGSLYRGDEHRNAVSEFIKYKKLYNAIPDDKRGNWCWITSGSSGIAKIRNTAIGTLLIDLSEEVDLDSAVKKWEKVMAPENFKRPKAIFTKKMVEQAEVTMIELGLEKSLGRKHACLEDITVNNVLWTNRDAKKKMGGSIFDEMKEEITENPKSYSKVEEVGIEDFVKNILPKATNVEIMVENRHNNNFMNLIAPTDVNAPSILQWSNNFSSAFNGDVASSMRERVSNAGGRVDGVFRFTHSWNELERNESLMDLHVFFPGHDSHKDGKHDRYGNNERVGWNHRNHPRTGGVQDVDYTNKAPANYIPIENITFPKIDKMPEGVYPCKIHNWDFRGTGGRGKAEIEVNGEVYQYVYPATTDKEWITVAEVTLKNGVFTIDHKLPVGTESKEIWGITTNKFTKVNVAMLSPNYWDGQQGIGHKQYYFFMDECRNEGSPRGFFNEHLNTKLMVHKRVFEAMSAKMRVAHSDNQMAGLGFSSTERNSIVVRVESSIKRMLKIMF